MRRLLRLLLLLLALLALAGFAAARWVARPMVERAASAALGAPVAIGSLSLRPWAGEVVASEVTVGEGEGGIAAESLAARLDLRALLRRELVVERIAIENPAATLRFDERYRLVSPAFAPATPAGAAAPAAPSRTPSPAAGGREGEEAEGSAAAIPLVLREVVVDGGALQLVYPIGKRTREVALAITRFTASDITLPSEGYDGWLHAVFEGAIAGAPLAVDTILRLGGEQAGAGGTLSLTDLVIDADLLPLPEQFAGLTARVDAEVAYETRPGAQTPSFELDLTVDAPTLSGEEGSKLGARRALLPRVRVDPAKGEVDLGAVVVEGLDLDAALTDDGVVLPLVGASGDDAGAGGSSSSRAGRPAAAAQGRAGAEGSPWAVSLASLELRGGEIRLRRGEAIETLAVRSARLKGFEEGRRHPFRFEAAPASGGMVSIEGDLGLTPLDADLGVRARELSLPALARLLPPLPLALDRGTGEADLRLVMAGEKLRLAGRVEAADLRSAPPSAARASEVLAAHRLTAQIAVDPAAEPMLDIATLELAYPYVMVQRHADGIFPFSLLGGGEEEGGAELNAAEPARAALARLGQVAVEGGKLEFMDMTLEPPYWTMLAGIGLRAEDILLPQSTVASFRLEGRHDELSPVEISGSVTPIGLEVKAEVRDLLLESMNAYVAPLLGYRVTAGRLSLTGATSPSAETLQSVVEVVVRGIDVLQTGADVIRDESGVPLPIALGLISNAAGQIDLKLPLSIDRASGEVSLGSIVGQAVRRAIVGALTSPLRLLGSLFGTDGAPHAFAIEPIPFAVGRGELDDAGRQRIAEVARIVDKNESLLVITQPQLTAEDLAAVGADEAGELAAERQAAVREALRESGLPAERIVPAEWTPEVGAKATGRAGVYVELQG